MNTSVSGIKVAKMIQEKFWEKTSWLKISEIKPKNLQTMLGFGVFRSSSADYKFINDLNMFGVCHGMWLEGKQIIEVDPIYGIWYENIKYWMPDPPFPTEFVNIIK